MEPFYWQVCPSVVYLIESNHFCDVTLRGRMGLELSGDGRAAKL
jgi:hypothetical protein